MDRPNTPHDKKKSVKLSLERIELLRESYKKHHNYRLVGRIFHVSPPTVKYWVSEDERKMVIKRTQEDRKKRMRDTAYRDRMNVIKNKNARDLRKSQPDIGQWEKDNAKEYRENNPEIIKLWSENNRHKWAKYASKSYYKNRDSLLAKKKEKYWLNRLI